MTDIWFTVVRQTLFELLADDRYLGARPGLIATLHTWSQTRVFHPHLPCLVTGGGVTDARGSGVVSETAFCSRGGW
jgi:Putative transposase